MTRIWATRERDDAGGAAVFTLGWIVVVLLALLTVAAATDVHIQRVRLMALADEASLAALSGNSAYGGNPAGASPYFGSTAAQVDAHVVTAATAWVANRAGHSNSAWVAEVVVVDAEATGDGGVSVTLARQVPLLFGLDALAPWHDGIDVVVTSRAREF
ncbi:pilus assembly protein TadG-related protein [Demequina sediminicola]|uniref:pilus assembly protein TadG-related protein n=1 Tax=Demequina sediminicola TaxID=1095026 RepID=UPI00078121AA|nr:pilus assembly protein TadG-related protein [Demequina sediminicola]